MIFRRSDKGSFKKLADDITVSSDFSDWDSNSSILDRRAFRLNLEAFKRRLREIGFFEDLSDAYVTQKVSPRYVIERRNGDHKHGRHA